MKKLFISLFVLLCTVTVSLGQAVTPAKTSPSTTQAKVTPVKSKVTKTKPTTAPATKPVTGGVVFKKDGTVDRRYKTSVGLKKDGTKDKRFKAKN